VFGLPGNPVSCLTNMYLFVAPMLRRIARLPPPLERIVSARLAEEVSSPRGRHQVYPVRLEGDAAVPGLQELGRDHEPRTRGRVLRDPSEVERVEAGTRVDVILF
jgi:molybdopterin molybdotransferase